jgi:hypothetical protein
VHLQSGSRGAGTRLGHSVDYTFYVGRSGNCNLGLYNYRIPGFQMNEVTTTNGFSADGADKREWYARASRDGDR